MLTLIRGGGRGRPPAPHSAHVPVPRTCKYVTRRKGLCGGGPPNQRVFPAGHRRVGSEAPSPGRVPCAVAGPEMQGPTCMDQRKPRELRAPPSWPPASNWGPQACRHSWILPAPRTSLETGSSPSFPGELRPPAAGLRDREPLGWSWKAGRLSLRAALRAWCSRRQRQETRGGGAESGPGE